MLKTWRLHDSLFWIPHHSQRRSESKLMCRCEDVFQSIELALKAVDVEVQESFIGACAHSTHIHLRLVHVPKMQWWSVWSVYHFAEAFLMKNEAIAAWWLSRASFKEKTWGQRQRKEDSSTERHPCQGISLGVMWWLQVLCSQVYSQVITLPCLIHHHRSVCTYTCKLPHYGQFIHICTWYTVCLIQLYHHRLFCTYFVPTLHKLHQYGFVHICPLYSPQYEPIYLLFCDTSIPETSCESVESLCLELLWNCARVCFRILIQGGVCGRVAVDQ